MMLHTIFMVTKFILLGLVAAGPNVFATFGRHAPPWYLWTQENKIVSLAMVYIIGGQIEGALISTGAFEVYYNGLRLYSAIESGQPPKFEYIAGMISNQIIPNQMSPNGFTE